MKNTFILATVAMLAIGCQPDIAVVDPPPPPPEVFADCSHSFTVAVEDTNSLPPPSSVFERPENYYENYQVYDISFSPNDPNLVAISMSGYVGISELYKGSIILIKDLCSGDETVIYKEENYPIPIFSIDWGLNDVILFSAGSKVKTIKANGDSLTTIPFQLSPKAGNIRWCPNLESFLIVRSGFILTMQVNLDGVILNEDLGFYGADFDYISDEVIGYVGDDVGVFEQASGNEVLNPGILGPIGSLNFGIAYSSYNSALLWGIDTIVALTDIATGTRTELANGLHPVRFYKSVAATKNGYLAYVAEVTSQALTTSSEWFIRTEIRFINPDGTDERRLVLDFE